VVRDQREWTAACRARGHLFSQPVRQEPVFVVGSVLAHCSWSSDLHAALGLAVPRGRRLYSEHVHGNRSRDLGAPTTRAVAQSQDLHAGGNRTARRGTVRLRARRGRGDHQQHVRWQGARRPAGLQRHAGLPGLLEPRGVPASVRAPLIGAFSSALGRLRVVFWQIAMSRLTTRVRRRNYSCFTEKFRSSPVPARDARPIGRVVEALQWLSLAARACRQSDSHFRGIE
jgi:hypothetical protein